MQEIVKFCGVRIAEISILALLKPTGDKMTFGTLLNGRLKLTVAHCPLPDGPQLGDPPVIMEMVPAVSFPLMDALPPLPIRLVAEIEGAGPPLTIWPLRVSDWLTVKD